MESERDRERREIAELERLAATLRALRRGWPLSDTRSVLTKQ